MKIESRTFTFDKKMLLEAMVQYAREKHGIYMIDPTLRIFGTDTTPVGVIVHQEKVWTPEEIAAEEQFQREIDDGIHQ